MSKRNELGINSCRRFPVDHPDWARPQSIIDSLSERNTVPLEYFSDWRRMSGRTGVSIEESAGTRGEGNHSCARRRMRRGYCAGNGSLIILPRRRPRTAKHGQSTSKTGRTCCTTEEFSFVHRRRHSPAMVLRWIRAHRFWYCVKTKSREFTTVWHAWQAVLWKSGASPANGLKVSDPASYLSVA